VIEAHNRNPNSVDYPDLVHASAVVWQDETRKQGSRGSVRFYDAAPSPDRRVRDQQSLGSGPELKGSRPGRVGASEAWNEDPPILVQRLDGAASDYTVRDAPDGNGCALYRRARKASTGDVVSLSRARDAQQHSILRNINEANRAAWGKPEAQGKS
jgi:hypothetical protein